MYINLLAKYQFDMTTRESVLKGKRTILGPIWVRKLMMGAETRNQH